MSGLDFSYQARPNRVVFGSHALDKLEPEARGLGMSRALVLCTPQQVDTAQMISSALKDLAAGICSRATMHTPVEVTTLALEDLHNASADGIVSVGGGSTIGLGKALAVRSGLPHLAIPTTYAGSEMTDILGETENGVKTTRRDPGILPRTTIYDVELTLGLPVSLSATSGMNAVAHAVEALYAEDGNPITSLMAEQSIRSFGRSLPMIQQNPADQEARELAFYGSWLAGVCLSAVSMSLHHKLCHVLGGSFDLPHSETHTVVLPFVVAFLNDAAPDAIAIIRRALETEHSAARGLQDLARRLGAPTSLKAIGMKEEWLDRAADLAVAKPYWTPRPMNRESIRHLLGQAYSGETPD